MSNQVLENWISMAKVQLMDKATASHWDISVLVLADLVSWQDEMFPPCKYQKAWTGETESNT